MLRPLTKLTSALRRRAPGARERLAYRMLQVLVVEPEAHVVRVPVARRDVPR
jgi:hypothetical protein